MSDRLAAMPDTLNVLLIGGGGREHALAWKLRQSPRLGRLWVEGTANAGLKAIAEVCPEPTSGDHFRLDRWCERESIGLVIIGPEAPLAAGWADRLATPTRPVFGPVKAGARLEADKAWAKDIMRSAAIPTAEGRTFSRLPQAIAYAETREEGCVVKAAGLAAGKGVVVCDTPDEAVEAVRMIMGDDPERPGRGSFGEAGNTVVIEEKLLGQEMSVLALVDGRSIWVLDPCQDHKQVGEGDVGPNTGGMGAYCPTPLASDEVMREIERDVLVPTVDALRREGITFRGVLYAGLMLTTGGPKVLEFNCRFGDPECQPLMARMRGDVLETLWATATGHLDDLADAGRGLDTDPRTACCVVLCSEGYPGRITTGHEISGIEDAEACGGPDEEVVVFHAGTTTDAEGRLVTSGGRVLGITALAADLERAQTLANEAAGKITFRGAFFRRDIGSRVLVPKSD